MGSMPDHAKAAVMRRDNSCVRSMPRLIYVLSAAVRPVRAPVSWPRASPAAQRFFHRAGGSSYRPKIFFLERCIFSTVAVFSSSGLRPAGELSFKVDINKAGEFAFSCLREFTFCTVEVEGQGAMITGYAKRVAAKRSWIGFSPHSTVDRCNCPGCWQQQSPALYRKGILHHHHQQRRYRPLSRSLCVRTAWEASSSPHTLARCSLRGRQISPLVLSQ